MTGTDDIDEDLGPECPCDLCNPWAGESDDDTLTPEPATDPYEMEEK